MSAHNAPSPYATVDKYLQDELQTGIEHEYLAGQILALDGASDRHGLIAGELLVLLKPYARLQSDL